MIASKQLSHTMITIPTIVPRWTTAILSRFLALNISPAIRSYPAPVLHISAHPRSYASRSSHLSPEELERKKLETKARIAERQRLRYHSDPEYRNKTKLRASARYATNPEYRETVKQHTKQRYAADPKVREKLAIYMKEKYATDPEFRQKKIRYDKERFANDLEFRERASKAKHKSWLKLKSRLAQDPEAYQLSRHKYSEAHYVMYREDADYRWAMALRTRVVQTERLRNEVVWKYHEPVLYSSKMDYNCATCRHKRYGGLKLWYVSDSLFVKARTSV
jgi:hypothetical protein